MSDETRDANVRLNAEIDPYRRQLQLAGEDTNKLATQVDKLSAKLDGLTKRAGKKLLLFGAAGAAGLTAVTADAANFEKKLSTLNATSEITGVKMSKIRGEIKNLTKEFPVSRDQAIELVKTLDKLGLSGSKNLRMIAESSVKLSAATGEDLTGLTTGVVTLQRQMGTLNAGTMDVFANSLVKVSKHAGVSATGVLSFASAIAPAARAAEMSQAQVLGVSAAFQKAGADGYLAANTFNSILTDVTRQIQYGSPDIAKYANLVGATVDEFKRMDKGEAITQIFEAINKQGPNAVKTLDRLGFDGVRAMRSIQAVSQSGGLRKAINDAVGGYTTTDELDRGSKVAMDGLFDEMQRTKSAMQDITTSAGTPLLGFFSALNHELNTALHMVQPLAEGFAKIGATLGALTSGGSMLLGGAMAMAGVKTLAGTAGFVAKSAPVAALRGGMELGRYASVGELPPEGSKGYAALQRAAAGEMRWHERNVFLAGQGLGTALGDPRRASLPTRVLGPLLTAPLKGVGMVFDAQRQMYDSSRIPGHMRPSSIIGGAGNLANALRPSNFRDFATGFRSGGLPEPKAIAGAMRDPEDFGKAMRASAAETVKRTAAEAAHLPIARQLTVQTGVLARQFISLQAAGVRATASLAMSGAKAAGASLGSAVYGLAGANPWMAGAMAAGGVGYLAYANRNQGKVEISDSAPIDKYNAALGLATSELGSFTAAVISATKALPKETRLEGTKEVSAEVGSLARTPKRELTNDLFDNLKFGDSRAAMMQLMGIEDPRQMQLVQADIYQARGQRQAQKATDIFFDRREKGLGVDYGALVRDIDTEQGQGVKGKLGAADPTAAKMVDAVYTSLMAQQSVNAKSKNETYANQVQVNELRGFLGEALGENLDIKWTAAGPKTEGGRTATQAVQGFEEAFLGGEKTGFKASKFAKATAGMSNDEVAEYFFTEHLGQNKNKKVSGYIADLQEQFPKLDFGGVGEAGLRQMALMEDSDYRRRVKGVGTLGNVALNNQTVQRAMIEEGNVNSQYRGINELLSKAKESSGGSFAGVDAELQKLKVAAGTSSERLWQLADAAQKLNQEQRADAMQYTGRVGRLSSSVSNFQSVTAAGRGEGESAEDYEDRVANARRELQGQKKAYADYVASIIQAQKNFAIQRRRGEKDLNIAISQSNEDFQISMEQAEEDYNLTRLRSQRDFGIQMTQATEDFHLQMSRGQEDFNRSLKRQAEDLAQSIYDPFARIRLQFTMEAGSMLDNVKNQTRFINDQVEAVHKLKDLGLSQASIDMLRLADPDMAQQAIRMEHDLVENPDMIKKINKQTKKRQGAVEELTQTPINQDYRRTMEDYKRSVDRAVDDFERGQQRAKEANARMLADMAKNYDTAVTRAAEAQERGIDRMEKAHGRAIRRAQKDLVRMSDEVYENFGTMMTKAISLVTANLGSMGDSVVAELKKVRDKFPLLFQNLYEGKALDPNVGSYAPPSPRAAEGPAKRKQKHALGGIMLSEHEGIVAEAGPEAIIPLDRRGVAFLSGMMTEISRSMVRDMKTIPSQTIYRGAPSAGKTVYDYSTTFTGNIVVQAEDPRELARKLADQTRLKKLTRSGVKAP